MIFTALSIIGFIVIVFTCGDWSIGRGKKIYCRADYASIDNKLKFYEAPQKKYGWDNKTTIGFKKKIIKGYKHQKITEVEYNELMKRCKKLDAKVISNRK